MPLVLVEVAIHQIIDLHPNFILLSLLIYNFVCKRSSIHSICPRLKLTEPSSTSVTRRFCSKAAVLTRIATLKSPLKTTPQTSKLAAIRRSNHTLAALCVIWRNFKKRSVMTVRSTISTEQRLPKHVITSTKSKKYYRLITADRPSATSTSISSTLGGLSHHT
jgi:hypothetical protein